MQQRYYDPVAGRFLSVDPVVTDWDSGSSFNRYVYAQNNPYRYIDPDGRQTVCTGMECGPILQELADGQKSKKQRQDTAPVSGLFELDEISDFAAGFGDSLSFGLTSWVRNRLDIGGVNNSSRAYSAGSTSGTAFSLAGGGGGFAAVKGGSRILRELPALDSTGKVHGILPSVKDLKRYDADSLARLRDELKLSVQRRIEVTVQKGSDFGHAERQAAEQQLLRSIEKHLGGR